MTNEKPDMQSSPAPAELVSPVINAMDKVVNDPKIAVSRDFMRHWHAFAGDLAKAAISAMGDAPVSTVLQEADHNQPSPARSPTDTIQPGDCSLRIVYSDIPPPDVNGNVWAYIGPVGDYTSHPELQAALALVAMAFNRRNGTLSPDKHRELAAERDSGLALLDEARKPEREYSNPMPVIDGLICFIECLIENDPDDYAADGVTVLDVWRKDVKNALSAAEAFKATQVGSPKVSNSTGLNAQGVSEKGDGK